MNEITENIVMDYYIELLKTNKIHFLVNQKKITKKIIERINQLKTSKEIHDKICIAKELWKILFKTAMSYIDSDRQGYDELFTFFDIFVNFEELIYASDSFYRDHTLHSLWVYFLGEYLIKKPEYQVLFTNFNQANHQAIATIEFFNKLDEASIFSQLSNIYNSIKVLESHEDSIRCIIALTHDLGYPLKKISKINKSISEVLPYFSITKFDEFVFQFENIQQFYVTNFLEIISSSLGISSRDSNLSFEDLSLVQGTINKINEAFLLDRRNEINDKVINDLKDDLKKIGDKEKHIISQLYNLTSSVRKGIRRMLRYSNDFERYEHGIMSSFLLMKTLSAFSSIDISYTDSSNMQPRNFEEIIRMDSKVNILQAIANHTSSGYKIRNFDDYSSFLILIDEIEEFSRISRANQYRQYINEFCKTKIGFEKKYLHIDFIFDNENVVGLNPELTFKGKCKRFLNLLDIPNLADEINIIFRCIGKLANNSNSYELEITKGFAKISINGKEQDIASYLKTEDLSYS